MATDWGNIINNKTVKIIAIVLTVMLVAVVCVGLFTNKYISIAGIITFNRPEEKLTQQPIIVTRDTTPMTMQMPPTTFRKEKIEAVSQIKKPDTISPTVQNNAPVKNQNIGPNYGHVGDTYEEKQLTEEQLYKLFESTEQVIKNWNLTKREIGLNTVGETNRKIYSQIKDYFIAHHYFIRSEGWASTLEPVKGVAISDTTGGLLSINVGAF